MHASIETATSEQTSPSSLGAMDTTKESAESSLFLNLPKEDRLKILSYTDPQTIAKLAAASKLLKDDLEIPYLWRLKIKQYFPYLEKKKEGRFFNQPYELFRKEYLKRYRTESENGKISQALWEAALLGHVELIDEDKNLSAQRKKNLYIISASNHHEKAVEKLNLTAFPPEFKEVLAKAFDLDHTEVIEALLKMVPEERQLELIPYQNLFNHAARTNNLIDEKYWPTLEGNPFEEAILIASNKGHKNIVFYIENKFPNLFSLTRSAALEKAYLKGRMDLVKHYLLKMQSQDDDLLRMAIRKKDEYMAKRLIAYSSSLELWQACHDRKTSAKLKKLLLISLLRRSPVLIMGGLLLLFEKFRRKWISGFIWLNTISNKLIGHLIFDRNYETFLRLCLCAAAILPMLSLFNALISGPEYVTFINLFASSCVSCYICLTYAIDSYSDLSKGFFRETFAKAENLFNRFCTFFIDAANSYRIKLEKNEPLSEAEIKSIETGIKCNDSWFEWGMSAFNVNAWKEHRAYYAGKEIGFTEDQALLNDYRRKNFARI